MNIYQNKNMPQDRACRPCVPTCCPPSPAPCSVSIVPIPGPTGATGPTGAVYLGKMTVCKNAVSIKPPRYGY